MKSECVNSNILILQFTHTNATDNICSQTFFWLIQNTGHVYTILHLCLRYYVLEDKVNFCR